MSTVAATDTSEPMVVTDSFTVDLTAKTVRRGETKVHLPPPNGGMLEMLVRNKGKLVGQKELLREAWGPAYATETPCSSSSFAITDTCDQFHTSVTARFGRNQHK